MFADPDDPDYDTQVVCAEHLSFIPCRRPHEGEIPYVHDDETVARAHAYQAGAE